MNCEKCGYHLSKDAKFCGKCGNKVDIPLEEGSLVVENQSKENNAISFVLFTAGLIMQVLFYLDSNSSGEVTAGTIAFLAGELIAGFAISGIIAFIISKGRKEKDKTKTWSIVYIVLSALLFVGLF